MAKTIAIFSTKGGVGKTFVSMNLAVSLGYYSGKKVALIDLDLQAMGDMLRLFDIRATRAMPDLAEALTKPGAEQLNLHDYILPIEKFKIDLLPAILTPRQAARLDAEKIGNVLKFMEDKYDYIIVDAGRAFTESLFAVFNHANLILLAVTPDVISVYQTKWSLDVLQSLHLPLNMVKLVLNRAESIGGVGWQEIRAAIPCEIIGRIPSEGKTVGVALNRRFPVVVDSPNSRVAQAIRRLEKEFLERQGLFLEHHEISLSAATQEELLIEEGEFWKKFKIDKGAVSSEESEDKKEADEVTELKKRIHQKLIEKLDLKHLEIDMTDPVKAKQIREKTEAVISTALAEETGVFLSSFEVRKRLVKEISDEALGLGPLEDLIDDNNISDIMVNNRNQIYIERFGKIELSPKRFLSNEQVRQVIERIIAPLGRRIDELVPMVDARLPDGSRVNAIIPPLSLTGPTLTIRKFGRERLTIDDLLRLNTMSDPMREFLRAAVSARKNVIVSGGTGSGKTTVLNVLSTFIPENERIISIEDAAELKLRQEHWVRLESRPPNIEGKGEITIRDLFRNSLRMRPDRVIIGECRGNETLDMLQAMNTGHDGSMTTIHANSTTDVLTRLDSMILMSGAELPIRAIREMVASAIDVIIHTTRLPDGTRKVMQVTEVTGMKDDMHIDLQDIFVFKQTGIDAQAKVLGSFQATGYIPSFMDEIKIRGIHLPEDVFKSSEI
ncbi:MAG: ATPase, T2SS/T4P/T4SS family [Candidatus Omnitrophica bacterium]|nr:ATPase, T2SS/T4P/T4SS family [Candidatus Omnitrophota bacterium]